MLTFGHGIARAQTPVPGASAGVESPAPAATKFNVQVVGGVRNPGSYVLEGGARLSDALAVAGLSDVDAANARAGIPPDARGCTFGGADLHRVYLVRAVESSRSATYMIDVALARQHKDLRYDPLLRANDKIYVPECRPTRIQISTPPINPLSES